MKYLRHRSLFLFGGALVAFAASLWSDPDHGFATMLGGLSLVQGVWAVAAAFWAHKAIFDYPSADKRNLLIKSAEGSTGAGLALVALALVFCGLLMVFAPRAQAAADPSWLPAGFIKYGPTLKAEQMHYWPDHPDAVLLAGLVEQESCITLKSRGCWNPAAKLKTSREEGAGMGQITRAYRANGALRFDSLSGLRNQYRSELAGWSWDNVYERPELQLRAIVLMSRDAARSFRAAPAMLAFGDAGYNGGVSGVQKERRACAMSAGCDAGRWFGHVENHCLKSRRVLYGNRNACDINREHVRYAVLIRPEKYREQWEMI